MKVSGSGNGISKPVNPTIDRSGLSGEFADDYMAEGVLMSLGLRPRILTDIMLRGSRTAGKNKQSPKHNTTV